MQEKRPINKGTLFQLFAAVIANLMAISDGMTVGWTSPMIPYFLSEKSHIKITKHEAEWLETWLLIGSIAGLVPTIYAVNKKGRKVSLLLASFALLVSWVIIALVNKIEYIYVARIISGMGGDMAFVAAPMYIAEIADQRIRGFLSSVIYLMMLTGVLLIYIVGPFLPFYFPSLLGVILLSIELIVFSLLPETPYYLISKGKHEEAKRSLQKFRSTDDVASELKEISSAIEKQMAEKGRIQDIVLIKNNRKAMLIMTVLNAAQQLSSINVILMNMHTILEAAGSIYMESSSAAILFAALMLSAATTASFFIDKFGRKKLLIISSVLTGFCLLSLAIYFNLQYIGYNVSSISWIPIASVMVYAFVYKFGLGMVPIVITAEIFAPKVKAMGMAIADAIYVLAAIFSLQIYQILLSSVGMHIPFYVFSACSFLTNVFIFFIIPETKGRSLEEIQMILQGNLQEKDKC
ncbi:facilitated trehalose transporter Tret1 [Anoplophora glabripennis]|uniref:facilitated trehalose transporter Tret1 n=1 Tax=Anoplophora glabripennis TaxID=217634 RepID=UPI000873ADC4|nr:facilitated trehalose transporter Tret1 [Anoplophora glabripennis]